MLLDRMAGKFTSRNCNLNFPRNSLSLFFQKGS